VKIILVIVIVICLTVLLIGVFLWPTVYRYDKISLEGISLPLKINRITGKTEIFFWGSGWTSYKEGKIENEGKLFPPDELAKVEVTGSLSSDIFHAEFYNGSSWNIERAMFQLTIREEDGTVRWKRKYSNIPPYRLPISPFSKGEINISVTDIENVGSWDFHIVELRGRKVE